MELSFNFENLRDPKRRLVLGALLLVIGVFCVLGHTWNSNVTKSDCTTVEAVFDDCKYRSLKGEGESKSIYLTFKDYPSKLDIHSSCTTDGLTEKLMKLKSGTKMQLLVNEESLFIYELKVDGETWLSFDDAMAKIENNMIIVKYGGYVAFVVGVIFLFSAIPSLLRRRNCKEL